MCPNQRKLQVCVVGLFSLMPSAAGGMGRYRAEFGRECCSIFPLVSLPKYTLSPPPHSQELVKYYALGDTVRVGKMDGWRRRS